MPENVRTYEESFAYARSRLINLINAKIATMKSFKISFTFFVEMYKMHEGEIMTVETFPFTVRHMMIHPLCDFQEGMDERIEIINNLIDGFLNLGSGWVVDDVLYVEAEIAKCPPLAGSCGRHEVKYVRNQGVQLVNTGFDNESDGKCFFFAISQLFCGESEQEQFIEENMIINIPHPVKVDSIDKFEEDNKPLLDLAINVIYQDEDGDVVPVRASKNSNSKNKVVLLLSQTKTDSHTCTHYTLVIDPDELLRKRKRGASGETKTVPTFICFNCFTVLSRRSAYDAHVKFCHSEPAQRVEMPAEGSVIRFKQDDQKKKSKIGYTLFFDFETLQKPPDKPCNCSEEMIKNRREGVSAKKVCKHKSQILKEQPAFAFSYIMVDRHGSVVEKKAYAGVDASYVFVEALLELETKYISSLQETTPMIITEKQQKEIDNAVLCYLCEDPLNMDRVRDHDHISGEFLGVAHSNCNLHRREQLKIVCFAHNFSGYDSHLIVRELGKFPKDKVRISAIPLNTQKFKSIVINNRIVMLDSMSFLSDSLGKLVNTLVKSDHDFPLVKQWISEKRQSDLLLRKGVYPYAFATSLERLQSQKCLPKIEEFFNDIGGETISKEDHEHAKKVWDEFGITNMLEYTMLYVRSDVYQLAEAVTHMRNSIYAEHELDICHYLSLPMLTKDLMLKMTEVKMELISDREMATVLKKNIRGGLSFINTRHFDLKELSERCRKIISAVYVDANNLYGAAMMKPLPLRDFRWMRDDELEEISKKWEEMITEEEGPGYILEVDLEYPSNLHLDHSSFPLAPHKRTITEKDLSPYSFKCMQEFSKKTKYKSEKLVATFEDRERYLVHGLNLKLYLQLGLRLKKIHRGITFFQVNT
jgi:hypothetical protein